MQLTGPLCVRVCVTVCVRVAAFRAASPHGRGHDTPGLYTLHCARRLCDSAPCRGLDLALRQQHCLQQLGDYLVVFHEYFC
jgi:hypothetical protein